MVICNIYTHCSTICQEVGRMSDNFMTRSRKMNANSHFTNHRNDNFSHCDLRIPGNLKSKSKSKKTSRKPSTVEANKKTSQKPSTGEANEGLMCCLGPFCAEYDTDSSTGVDGNDTSQPGQYLYRNDDISAIAICFIILYHHLVMKVMKNVQPRTPLPTMLSK